MKTSQLRWTSKFRSTGVSGTVAWSGYGEFDGEPLVETDFILRNMGND